MGDWKWKVVTFVEDGVGLQGEELDVTHGQGEGEGGQDEHVGHSDHSEDVRPAETALAGVELPRQWTADLLHGRVWPAGGECEHSDAEESA